jgi:hypothetical protein
MNIKNIFLMSLLCATTLLVLSCEKSAEPTFTATDKGAINLEFDNVVGTTNMQLNGTQTYTNTLGEQFNITIFNYYISNIKLKTEEGTVFTVPQDKSYFLIQESKKESQIIKLSDVPAGNYTEMTFTVGVDSLRNTMDIAKRTGVLDPANEDVMYWAWNSGYIFLKMEGLSPASPADPTGNKKFRYHIGGFGGYSSKTINNLKTITCKFGTSRATVRKDITPEVHTLVDALKLFNGTTNVSLKDNSTVMFAPFSVNIAANYVNMFSVDHVHNE